MDRSIVYLFIDGSWMYGAEFDPKFHSEKGKYTEVVFARGWSSPEITECLRDYYEDIYKEFGSWIAMLVDDLSDVSKPEDGNRSVRKEIDRQHTAQAFDEAKTIKLADLISNSKSICEHDKDFAKVYIKEKELLLEVLTEGDPTLYAQAKAIVEKAKKELGID